MVLRIETRYELMHELRYTPCVLSYLHYVNLIFRVTFFRGRDGIQNAFPVLSVPWLTTHYVV